MRTCLLMGRPGAGKSHMIAATALHQPVHILDIDRKVPSAGWAASLLQKGSLSFWDLAEPLEEENLTSRIRQLASTDKSQQKATKAPEGWKTFAERFQTMFEKDPVVKEAQTVAVDSLTQLGEHFKTHLMWLAGKNKLTFDQWMAYLTGWRDTLSVMRDLCKRYDKDLICTVHEKDKEMAGDRVTGVRYETTMIGGEMVRQRQYVGTLDLSIEASIDGQFGSQIAGYFDEVYHLYVDVNDKLEPTWRCRVHPDGLRPLRTSFFHKSHVFDPDFSKIWKNDGQS